MAVTTTDTTKTEKLVHLLTMQALDAKDEGDFELAATLLDDASDLCWLVKRRREAAKAPCP